MPTPPWRDALSISILRMAVEGKVALSGEGSGEVLGPAPKETELWGAQGNHQPHPARAGAAAEQHAVPYAACMSLGGAASLGSHADSSKEAEQSTAPWQEITEDVAQAALSKGLLRQQGTGHSRSRHRGSGCPEHQASPGPTVHCRALISAPALS